MTRFGELRTPYDVQIALRSGPTPAFHWFLDPEQLIDRSLLQQHLWEPYSTWAVEALVKSGMHVLDAGANMGYYTILLSHLVGSTGHVLAFEAMPEPAALTIAHCRLNQVENAEVRQHALGRKSADPAETFFNYSWPPTRCEQAPACVETIALDDLRLSRLDFAKVDLDGSELDFVVGAEDTLRRLRPAILLEVCDYTLRQTAGLSRDANYIYGAKTREMLEFLVVLGYGFLREQDFTRITADEVLAHDDLSKMSVNVICQVESAC